MSKDEAEQWAFETFANIYPHEAAEVDWAAFVAYTRKKAGVEIPEEEIRRLLSENN